MTVRLIDGIPEDVELIVHAFLDSKWCTKTIKRNPRFEVFNVIFGNRMPSSQNDFSDETFATDAIAIKSCKHYVASELKRFYCYLIDNRLGSFDVLNMQTINLNSIITWLQKGFVLVQLANSENIPTPDRWFLVNGNDGYPLDFAAVNSPKHRQLLKIYYWLQPVPNFKTKVGRFGYLKDFLNSITDDDDSSCLKVSTHTILTYKRLLLENHPEPSAYVILNGVKDFLHYIDNNGLLDANEYLFSLMKMANTKSDGNTKCFTGEQVERIVQEMTATYQSESNPDISTREQVLTIMFLYLLNSPMRLASLMSCRVSDLHQSETGAWYYAVDTKVQEDEKIEIPNELRSLHDDLLRITEPYRYINEEVSDYLFIIKRQRGGHVVVVNRETLGDWIDNTCNKLGIEPLGPSGVRNRFMYNVTRIITSKEGDQRALISGVSKHSLKAHYSNYVRADLDAICIQLFGTQMLDSDLAGIVSRKPDVPVSKVNAVMNGRGYCTCASCDDKTLLDCMMCKHYLTTPANIPYYFEAIEDIDSQLQSVTISEEKEFLKAKKALNATYLMKLLKLVNDEWEG